MDVINDFLAQSNSRDMKMQMLQIPIISENERVEKLETFIGMAHGITDPFNLFINVDDIENNRDFIYFFSYSMGKKKIVVWGNYELATNKINLQSACRFNSWKYIDYINGWKNMDYQIYDTITVNRFTPLINQYVRGPSDKFDYKVINSSTDYKAWSYILKAYNSEISEYELLSLFDNLDHDKLSYVWHHYNNGESPLLDFPELLGTRDIMQIEAVLIKQIGIFEDTKLSIRDENDLKAWTYMLAYFNDTITKEEFNLLFSKLNLSQLSYDYPHYKNGESAILDFYDMFGIDDLMDDYEIKNITDDIANKITKYETDDLNFIDDRAPENIKNVIMNITKLFLDYISRSKYATTYGVNSVELCPQSRLECSDNELRDANNRCAVFTYGKTSFSDSDPRNWLEEDLT